MADKKDYGFASATPKKGGKPTNHSDEGDYIENGPMQANQRDGNQWKPKPIPKYKTGGMVGDHDGSSAAMARGGSAFSSASVIKGQK